MDLAALRRARRNDERLRDVGIVTGPTRVPGDDIGQRAREVLRRDRVLRQLGIVRDFNTAEPREPNSGKWTAGGGGALKDVLKLAGKIDLGHDEKLVGSDKVAGAAGAVRIAVTEQHGERLFRLGIGSATFGGQHDDAGPWRAGPDPTAAMNAQRKELHGEKDSIEAELARLDADPHADPARIKALHGRYDELDNMDLGDVHPAGYTAKVDRAGVEHLRDTLTTALAAGKRKQAEVDAAYDRGVELPRPAEGFWTLAEGSITGEWGDVHYLVYLDDPSVGVEVHLGVVPSGSGTSLDDLSGAEQAARLDPAETTKLLRLLGKYAN